jgi:hypothetical protein
VNREALSSPSAALPGAFYRELGQGLFASSPATAGPWSPKWQHGGPPSALLARALEQHAPHDGFRFSRITVELPRPVPVADLQVSVRTVHSGRRVQLLEGEVGSGGDTVMYARAWRMAPSAHDTPVLRPGLAAAPLPGPQPPPTMAKAHLDGYIAAMEWRFSPGEGFDTMGPGTVWARQRIPLLAGQSDTPLTRAMTLVDSTWAVAFELDHHERLVINTDIALALHREPAGEWLCVRSATTASPAGSGLAVGQLDDATGDCGHVVQTLLVNDR